MNGNMNLIINFLEISYIEVVAFSIHIACNQNRTAKIPWKYFFGVFAMQRKVRIHFLGYLIYRTGTTVYATDYRMYFTCAILTVSFVWYWIDWQQHRAQSLSVVVKPNCDSSWNNGANDASFWLIDRKIQHTCAIWMWVCMLFCFIRWS